MHHRDLPPETISDDIRNGDGLQSLFEARGEWSEVANRTFSAASRFKSCLTKIEDAWEGQTATQLTAELKSFGQWLTDFKEQVHQAGIAIDRIGRAFHDVKGAVADPDDIRRNRQQRAQAERDCDAVKIAELDVKYDEFLVKDIAAMDVYESVVRDAAKSLSWCERPPRPAEWSLNSE